MPTAPAVDCDRVHPTLPVADVLAAADFYTRKLGFQLAFTWGDPPELAGMNLASVQLFLQLGQPNPAGCSVSFVVGDADQLFEFQRANGVTVVIPPEDRPYGLRDYRIADLYGYELIFVER